MRETFTCAACGKVIDADQLDEWGTASMCKPCAQSCEQLASSCDHVWLEEFGIVFCGVCAALKKGDEP